MKFLNRVRMLYRIVLAQQATRIILRAAWLGGAVYLLGWGINAQWGILPQNRTWVLAAVIVSFGTLATLLFKPRSAKNFLWRVDETFDLKEQVTTAYEVSTDKKEKQPGGQQLEKLLVEDANSFLPDITRKVIDKGWGLRNDVEATIIVLMMLMVVYLSGLESFSTAIPGSGLGILPGIGSDPSFLDVFSSGIPGDTRGSAPGLGVGGQGEGALDGPLDLSREGLNLVHEVFREMGDALKDSAATSGVGHALSNGDFEKAANEMSGLAENIDRVTAETRQDLAERFSDAARKLFPSQFTEISNTLNNAAEALRGNSSTDMSNQLDRVSDLLQSLGEYDINEVIASDLEEPEPTEFEGLEGEDEPLEFETAQDISNMLTAPGVGSAASGLVEGTPLDFEGYSLDPGGDGVWSPFDYSWDDKDVVSSYFTPR